MPRAAGRPANKKIQQLRWELITARSLAMAPGTVASTIIAAATFQQTIMRTRGELLGYIDGVQAPGALCRWAVGLVLVPEGQGTTTIWSPLTDPNAPWFVYMSGHLAYEEFVTDVLAAGPTASFRKDVDSKAMRKIPPDTEVQAVFEQTDVSGTPSINLNVIGRILLGRT